MVKCTVNRKNLLKLINSMGSNIGDLCLRITGDKEAPTLSASIGYYTHYLRLTTPCTADGEGAFSISDVNTMTSFLRTGKEDTVILLQDGMSKMLYVTCGKSKIHLPGAGNVSSNSLVSSIEKLLQETKNNLWTKWANRPLTCSATIDKSSLDEVVAIHTVLGENPLYTADFYTGNSEMIVKAGKKSKGRMFAVVSLENVKGLEKKTSSTYGANFPINLKSLPSGKLAVYMGDDAPMIITHEGSDACLIVFDCDYEEGWE